MLGRTGYAARPRAARTADYRLTGLRTAYGVARHEPGVESAHPHTEGIAGTVERDRAHASRVRLADIATRAEVSEATVSRVLNNRPGVSEHTRVAVLAALDVLGYERPTWLRTKTGALVGLIIPELTNPIFPAFAQSIESLLADHGVTPVLCTQSTGGLGEDDYVRMLLERGVAGIIFISGRHADSGTDPAPYRELVDRGLPIVLVNGFVEEIEAPFISNDDVASMDLAVRHLVELGHTRIGLAVGPARFVPVIRKVHGFRAAMAALLGATEVEDLVATSVFSVEGGATAARSLVEAGATALVCGSDLMALGAIRQARAMGLAVPRDLSVVGYDDSPLMMFTDPPLTTIRQSVEAMSAAAVRALLDEIDGVPAPRTEYVFRPELVVRGSTGAAPHG
jgi:DNA-binding LacI/PurR family transcriptional regulator